MMNLQELAIIGRLGLPIVIFVLNNHGYSSIRQTQNNYFPDNIVGCSDDSGLPFPSSLNLLVLLTSNIPQLLLNLRY